MAARPSFPAFADTSYRMRHSSKFTDSGYDKGLHQHADLELNTTDVADVNAANPAGPSTAHRNDLKSIARTEANSCDFHSHQSPEEPRAPPTTPTCPLQNLARPLALPTTHSRFDRFSPSLSSQSLDREGAQYLKLPPLHSLPTNLGRPAFELPQINLGRTGAQDTRPRPPPSAVHASPESPYRTRPKTPSRPSGHARALTPPLSGASQRVPQVRADGDSLNAERDASYGSDVADINPNDAAVVFAHQPRRSIGYHAPNLGQEATSCLYAVPSGPGYGYGRQNTPGERTRKRRHADERDDSSGPMEDVGSRVYEAAEPDATPADLGLRRTELLLSCTDPEKLTNAFGLYQQKYPAGFHNKEVVQENLHTLCTWFDIELPKRRKASGQPKKSHSEYFFRRFLAIRSVQDLTLSCFTLDLVSSPSLDAPLSPTSEFSLDVSLPNTPSNLANAAHYNAAVNTMENAQTLHTQSELVIILLHLFFFLARDPDPRTWADPARQRMAATTSRMADTLYDTFLSVMHENRDALGPSVPVMSRALFVEKVPRWVVIGSKYAFLARQLSPGALVYLAPYIDPQVMYGCSKGGEASGISARAIAHLKSIGLLERSAAANVMMHHLMWELLGKFQGVGARPRDGKFPGFD